MSDCFPKITTCLPGTQGTSLDIVRAYRNSALLPRHKPYMASMWKDGIYIDHCAMEGLLSAGNIQGAPADALVALLCHHGIPNVLKWVDDFCIFRSPSQSFHDCDDAPTQQYSFDLNSIHELTDPLGIPWHLIDVKGQDFASTVPYISFIWDLANHTVLLLEKKCTKYLSKVMKFQLLAWSKISCKDYQSIHGTL